MELILKETIDTLGEEGSIVNVKSGYGRNYLLPKGKAVAANKGNKAILEQNKATIEDRKKKQAPALRLLSSNGSVRTVVCMVPSPMLMLPPSLPSSVSTLTRKKS